MLAVMKNPLHGNDVQFTGSLGAAARSRVNCVRAVTCDFLSRSYCTKTIFLLKLA